MVMLALGVVPTKVKADWTIFEQTSIDGTVSGSIRKGHVFRTRSGNLYEVTDYVYLYEYEYRPDVVVLRDGNVYQLIIEGFDEPLTCRRLGRDGVLSGNTSSGSGLSHSRRSYPIEVAHNDELFVINGEKYEAKTYCLGWDEGESVFFLEGSAFGACVSAKLLNLDREEICEVWCE